MPLLSFCFCLLRQTNKGLLLQGSLLSNLVLRGCGFFPVSNILMVECLLEAGLRVLTSISFMISFRSYECVCIIQIFTHTSRSLHLPVGGQLIPSISIEMLGAAFLFPDIWNMVSPSSGLSDSTFLISSS